MKSNFKILHLSDLHFSKKHDAYNRGVILQALKLDLQRMCDEGPSPDLIVFSGDLVHGADEADVHLYLYDEVLSEISSITRCGDNRLIICPGNHDADRSIVSRRSKDQRDLISRLSGRDETNAAYLNGDLDDLVKQKFSAFDGLADLLASPSERQVINAFTTSYRMTEYAADFCVVNTAALTWTGLDKISDERVLVVPEASLPEQSSDGIKRARILVTHHPLSWLAQHCESDLSASIDGRVDFHLFGHMHLALPQQVTSMRGSCVRNQSGALYERRGEGPYNGYSVILCDVETGHSMVQYRSYFDKRREFDVGINVAKDGLFYPNADSKAFWYRHLRRVDRAAFRKWLIQDVLPGAQRSFNEGLVERPLCDVFVPPPLYSRRLPTEVGEEDVTPEVNAPVNLVEIVAGTRNVMLCARQEYGKTTLLRQIALSLLQNTADEQNPVTLPIIIDFGSIKSGQSRFNALLRSAIYSDSESQNLTQILEEGLATILVDDVDFSDRNRMKALREFMTENSRCRFIFTTTTNESGALAFGENVVANPETSLSFETVFLAPFTRKKMRTFVEKWDKDRRFDQEKVLNRIIREFSGINMPITAVNGTILLSIYEDLNEATLINRAVLIERFVEFLLEKPALSDVQRSAVDFKIKEHLLGFIAGSMARSGNYVLSRMDLYEVVKAHLAKFGFAWDPDDIIDMFVRSRVLSKHPDGCLSFRYRAFVEYFIAKQMMEDDEFRAWVLDEDRYLMFSNEVLYYAGLLRNDVGLLELVGSRFVEATKEAARQEQWMPDIRKLDDFHIPLPSDESDLFESFERQMDLPPMSSEERDELLEGEMPLESEVHQQVYRPKIVHIGHLWTMSLLLYSGVLKNMELVDDSIKRRHLAQILKSWGLLAGMSLAIVPALAKHREFKINGVLYKVNYPKHFTEGQIARAIYIDMPNSVGRLLLQILGTEKLERQLAEPMLDEVDEPSIVTYYRHSLIADMNLRGWVTGLDRLYGKIKHSAYLTEVFLRKTVSLYLLGDWSEENGRGLKQLVGTIISRSRPGDEKARVKRKARVMQDLDRKLLLRQTKLAASEARRGDETN